MNWMLGSLRVTAAQRRPAIGEALSTCERLSEVAEILAAGLVRLLARKSSRKSPDIRESSLDFMGHQSGHPNPSTPGELDG
jgi:hypothetical protein